LPAQGHRNLLAPYSYRASLFGNSHIHQKLYPIPCKSGQGCSYRLFGQYILKGDISHKLSEDPTGSVNSFIFFSTIRYLIGAKCKQSSYFTDRKTEPSNSIRANSFNANLQSRSLVLTVVHAAFRGV
jgi:hypothetical protein